MLKEKCALTRLRVELEGRKGKLCRSYKGFRHLARNCRNRKGGEKEAKMPQNKFEVLKSRVMQCGIEERVVRSMRMVVVRCFRCREEGHKCRECVITKPWRLKDHSRWVFRKNSIELFIGLTIYLYYFYKWLYTTSPRSHVFLECSTITCPCHMIWLLKFPHYLYLVCIIWLDICDQVFECMGNLFLLGALITWPLLQDSSSQGIFPSIPVLIPFLFSFPFVMTWQIG